MTYVICQPCINVKTGACVEVCPVNCIYTTEEEEQRYINPDECIECGACEAACPVNAIYHEEEVPAKWKSFIQKNADYFRKGKGR